MRFKGQPDLNDPYKLIAALKNSRTRGVREWWTEVVQLFLSAGDKETRVILLNHLRQAYGVGRDELLTVLTKNRPEAEWDDRTKKTVSTLIKAAAESDRSWEQALQTFGEYKEGLQWHMNEIVRVLERTTARTSPASLAAKLPAMTNNWITHNLLIDHVTAKRPPEQWDAQVCERVRRIRDRYIPYEIFLLAEYARRGWQENDRGSAEDWTLLTQKEQAKVDELLARIPSEGNVPERSHPAPPPRESSFSSVEQHVKPDLFLSYASEDKDAIARPLYLALAAEGVMVWFDEVVLELGDSLRQKIDEGLARCRYGVVILSPSFLAKQWPQRELDGLMAKETASGEKAILPIWHELNQETLMRYSPLLADRLAGRSEEGVPALVQKILRVLRR